MATYVLESEPKSAVEKELRAYSPLLRKLLSNRGITTKKQADAFLNPSYEDDLHDPFLLHDMEKAVERISRAITNNERVAIYSDYDCDGIPGAVVLHDFFKAIGFANFFNYIPHRHYEGFGFNVGSLTKLKEEKTTLIITIDCGTSDIDAVAEAEENGIDVVITDHHEPKETLPQAYAFVNPKIGNTYPFDGLCGSGVVFKLVQALLLWGEKNTQFSLKKGHEKWLLDMVGLATIADMVPLVGENRALVHYGLRVLRKTRRPGVQQLLRQQKASIEHLTEDDIGFTLGPRINAASRMDTPEDAFLLLATDDEVKAGAYVAHLEHLNNERKGVVASMTKEAHKRITAMTEVPHVLALGNPLWRPSLVGLVANKLAEEYKRPTFLWGRDGNGVIRGSCRSEGHTSVITLMNETKQLFIEHGGHHFSGGFGVHEDGIHTFSQILNDTFGSLGTRVHVVETTSVDAAITLEDISATFIQEQIALAPYGVGNPKPLFLFTHIIPREVAVFGKGKEHTKLLFDTKGLAKEAIAFFTLPKQFTKIPRIGETLSLYAHVEQSFFMGRLQTRLRIVDIV